MQQAVCPQCGSSAQVRTVAELFDMLNGMQDQAMQRAQGGPQQGAYPGQQGPYPGQGGPGPQGGQGYVYEGGYSENRQPGQGQRDRFRPEYDDDSFTGDIGQDVANAVIGTAARFMGRAIGRKVQKTIQERVVPAMQAKMAQAQQQRQPQQQAEQAAIVQRYPDLRGCLTDQVVFLAGGNRVVPISVIRLPVTMAQADDIAARLSTP
jgi:hypothetical protein